MKPTKILCPIDFSPTSTHALNMAVELAKASSSELVIAHAWHLPALFYSELSFPSNVADEMIETAKTELANATRGAKSAGVDRVSMRLVEGIPADAIIRILEEDAAFELVVIGANGRGGLGRFLMGSVAEKITRRAPCSVLAIHATHGVGPFARILSPIDFSESSLDAFDLALELVTPGGAITLLHVLETPASYSGDPTMSDFLSSLDQRSTAHLDDLIASSAERAKTAMATVGKATRIGNPGRQILSLLDSEPGFDLVVMGTHGRTGLRRLVLGSIAERVVRHAPCPVLVARKRAAS